VIHSAVGSALGHTFLLAGIVGLAGAALSLILMSRPQTTRQPRQRDPQPELLLRRATSP